MSILQNAVDSIAIGLEDYKSTDTRRILSSTRNIYAGILLLFKYKLSELSADDSDEALIKQRVLPILDNQGIVRWTGKGNKTVDFYTIKERFDSLNIKTDWKRLDKINSYRNEIEHYYSHTDIKIVQKIISDSFILIRDFITDELNKDPKQVLGNKYWDILYYSYEVYGKEVDRCDASIDSLDFYSKDIAEALKSYNCELCDSDFTESNKRGGPAIDAIFVCRSCGNSQTYEEIIDSAIVSYFGDDWFYAIENNNALPISNCLSCLNGIYITDSEVCVTCGEA